MAGGAARPLSLRCGGRREPDGLAGASRRDRRLRDSRAAGPDGRLAARRLRLAVGGPVGRTGGAAGAPPPRPAPPRTPQELRRGAHPPRPRTPSPPPPPVGG